MKNQGPAFLPECFLRIRNLFICSDELIIFFFTILLHLLHHMNCVAACHDFVYVSMDCTSIQIRKSFFMNMNNKWFFNIGHYYCLSVNDCYHIIKQLYKSNFPELSPKVTWLDYWPSTDKFTISLRWSSMDLPGLQISMI